MYTKLAINDTVTMMSQLPNLYIFSTSVFRQKGSFIVSKMLREKVLKFFCVIFTLIWNEWGELIDNNKLGSLYIPNMKQYGALNFTFKFVLRCRF